MRAFTRNSTNHLEMQAWLYEEPPKGTFIFMKYFRKLVCLLLVVLNASALAAQTEPPAVRASSAWTNQSGSTLYIDTYDPNSGLISGHYINRAAGYGCQNISYPVTGWIFGTAISFTTIWESSTESCNSITSWTGFYYQGQISTMWQLVVNGSTNTQQIIQGSDVFNQTAKTSKKSLSNAK
jgi:hypothetical protein